MTSTTPSSSPEAGHAPQPRLASLDALRGFDMFWITGGGALVAALASATDHPALRWLEHQTHHVEWHGFRLWDLIFPLFLFIAGVSMPFSLGAKLERGTPRSALLWSSTRRGLTLVALGVLYNGLLTFDFENLRYASVLGRIGLAWMLAAYLFLFATPRGLVLWTGALLLGYWAAMSWIPVPGFGAGNLEPGKTLADYVDRVLVPGRLHRGDRDPEGLFSTIPAIATALLGALAGLSLRGGRAETRRALRLAIAGLACLAIGWAWGLVFPLNKNLWTSSFVLWTAGLSLLLLSAFYQVIDVWGVRRWAFFFVVIGTNAITIYMLGAFVDFDALAALVFVERKLHPAMFAVLAIGIRWALLFALYQKRIFLRV